MRTLAISAIAASTPPTPDPPSRCASRSEEHTSELQSRQYLVCRLLLEKKKNHRQPMQTRAVHLRTTAVPPTTVALRSQLLHQDPCQALVPVCRRRPLVR